ncbi:MULTISPECIES: inositol monophosphatase family protein [unclassified Vibrio]|uniref:inositol monophosphatase family protein n=1 Tax=unclassified Vibrio TaxID=2614977 RepID=UPI00159D12BE|nr:MULTISPECIES: inositol monophosphatase family protein [unclassified Vibrio]NVN82672.1 inositol monophosphatase [Vibrio sp. Scap16]QLE93207.1 inositol monophosphatase [Vibrio sp. Scap24]
MSICQKLVTEIKEQLELIVSFKSTKVKKSDDSFVSKGDLLVQEIVLDFCSRYLPEHTLISEELAPFEGYEWNLNGSYVVLDPIDGTENFVSGLREWGVGISIYTKGLHAESCIYLPELDEVAISGQPLEKFESRIHGLSSSLTKEDLSKLPEGFEYRIIGCSMYNMLNAVKGSYSRFENVKGVSCWDILPGLNLALEHGVNAYVNGERYNGQLLFPTQKYKILLEA